MLTGISTWTMKETVAQANAQLRPNTAPWLS
jgi:hypothetical protein